MIAHWAGVRRFAIHAAQIMSGELPGVSSAALADGVVVSPSPGAVE